MRLLPVKMLAVFMLLSIGSGCSHRPKPVPIKGMDVVTIEQNELAPFSGILFSPGYLENYLEWKADQ